MTAGGELFPGVPADRVGAALRNHFRFLIPGEPVAWQRGKIVKRGAHMGVATPEKTRRYEDIIRQRATVEWQGAPLIAAVPITLECDFYRSVPGSWSKRKTADALSGAFRPISKPDADNLLKAVKDALNGVIYLDDALIVDVRARKFYSDTPRCAVLLRW